MIASYLPKPHADGSPIQASELPTSLPGYLIRLKPQISLEGQVVAQSAWGFWGHVPIWFDPSMFFRGVKFMSFSLNYIAITLLILIFFLTMKVDRRLLSEGGWLFYVNKIFALGAIFSAIYAVRNEVFGYVAVVFLIVYLILINFYLKKEK